MASLRSFMIRMNYLDRSSPFNNRKRRRRYSSATSGSSNLFTDLNHNELLAPIVNPSRSRRKVAACIYKPIPSNGTAEQSPQLAVEVFEGSVVKLRNEISIPVSTERFLAFVQMDSPDNAIVSTVYCVPRMVPISNVSTSYIHYDTRTAEKTIIYCTKVEFRRRYLPLAKQTIDNEPHKQEDHHHDRQPCFVSYASWNVSEC